MKAEDRQKLAADLLRKVKAAAGANAEIEDLKDQLRRASEVDGTFTVRVEGLGKVEVAAPRKGKFNGIMPTLEASLYMAMTPEEKAHLADAGIVVMTELYGREFYGSVTVKPD